MKLKFILLLTLLSMRILAHASGLDDIKAGLVASHQGRNEDATQEFTHALTDPSLDDTSRRTAFLQRGYIMLKTRRYAEAIADNTAALRISPNRYAYFNRGIAYKLSGNNSAAIQDMTDVIRLAPTDWKAYSNRGEAYANQKEYDLAIADYSKLIELRPGDTLGYGARAILLQATGKNEAAIEDFTEAIRLAPGQASWYAYRGGAFGALGEKNQALDADALMDFATALRIQPDLAYVYFARVQVLEREGRYAEAIEDYTNLIRLAPKVALFYSYRADDLSDLHSDEAARQDYATANRLDPGMPEQYYGLGQLEFDEGNFSASISDFARYSELTRDQKLFELKKLEFERFRPYAALFRYAASLRIGSGDKSALIDDASQLDVKKWPYPIVAYYLGKLNERQLWAATLSGDPQSRSDRICETDAYVGELALARNQNAKAKVAFQRAAKGCPVNFVEKKLANRELERLAVAR